MQAVVEGCDHLVLAFDAWIDLDETAQSIQSEHREARLGQRSKVAAGALDPHQLHLLS